jgi:hypothetical protein
MPKKKKKLWQLLGAACKKYKRVTNSFLDLKFLI